MENEGKRKSSEIASEKRIDFAIFLFAVSDKK